MRTNEQACTDAVLQENVTDAIQGEPSLREGGITVTVRHGVVTLAGRVASWAEKSATERAALRVYGVQAVANAIEVELPEGDAHADIDLAKAAAGALEWHALVPRGKVKVAVNGGWISLRGQVEWPFQREAAEDAVRNLRGLKGVLNEIAIQSRAMPDVTKKILTVLGKSPSLDASRITVESWDGRVILRGKVGSWQERSEAELAARTACGGVEIENALQVA